MTQTNQAQPGANTPAFIAWHVPQRRNAPWMRIGAAWPHRDGKGYSLKLELLPVEGGAVELRIYEPKADDEQPGSEGGQS